MIRVTMTTASAKKIELLPESMTVREAFETLEPGYAGNFNAINGVCLETEDLYRSLRKYAKGNALQLISVPRVDVDEPEPKCEPDLPEVDPPAVEDKVKEIQKVITELVKWLAKKAFRYMPLFLAVYWTVLSLLVSNRRYADYKGMFIGLSVMFVCVNLLWFFTNETKTGKKQEDKNDQVIEIVQEAEQEELPF